MTELVTLLEQLRDTPLDKIPADTAQAVVERLLKQDDGVEVARFGSAI